MRPGIAYGRRMSGLANSLAAQVARERLARAVAEWTVTALRRELRAAHAGRRRERGLRHVERLELVYRRAVRAQGYAIARGCGDA